MPERRFPPPWSVEEDTDVNKVNFGDLHHMPE
jgi:hypothetical protein